MRLLKSSQMKKMLSAPHVLSEQGLLQAGWKGGVFWPVHSRLRSSSTRATVDGAPLPIHAEEAPPATSESCFNPKIWYPNVEDRKVEGIDAK